jgi:hypothetical protein
MSDIREPKPIQAGILTKFLDELDHETREKFMRTVSRDELWDYSASEDEFRLITGEEVETLAPTPKPATQADAEVDEELREKLDKRLEEINGAFPANRSIDGLKKLADDRVQPKKSGQSLDDLKEKANPSLKVSISIETLRDMGNKG